MGFKEVKLKTSAGFLLAFKTLMRIVNLQEGGGRVAQYAAFQEMFIANLHNRRLGDPVLACFSESELAPGAAFPVQLPSLGLHLALLQPIQQPVASDSPRRRTGVLLWQGPLEQKLQSSRGAEVH